MSNDQTAHDVQDCVTDCKACHDVCMITIQHCLRIGGALADQRRIRLMADCSEFTQTTANFMLRGSEQRHQACRTCALICETCVEVCAPVAERDVQIQAFVEACRRCAVSCHAMAGEELILEGVG